MSSSDSFGITEGVHSVSMHAGSTLAITDPTKAKGIIFLPEHLSQNNVGLMQSIKVFTMAVV